LINALGITAQSLASVRRRRTNAQKSVCGGQLHYLSQDGEHYELSVLKKRQITLCFSAKIQKKFKVSLLTDKSAWQSGSRHLNLLSNRPADTLIRSATSLPDSVFADITGLGHKS